MVTLIPTMTSSAPVNFSSTYLSPRLPRSHPWPPHYQELHFYNLSFIQSTFQPPPSIGPAHYLEYPIPTVHLPHPDWSCPLSLSLVPPSCPYFSPYSPQLARSFITNIVYLHPELSCPNSINSHSCYLLTKPWPGWNPTPHSLHLHKVSVAGQKHPVMLSENSRSPISPGPSGLPENPVHFPGSFALPLS